jgi:hypothetical protein
MRSISVAAAVLVLAASMPAAGQEKPPVGTWQIVYAGTAGTSTASMAWVVNTATGDARACFIASPEAGGIFCTDWVNVATMPAGVQQ